MLWAQLNKLKGRQWLLSGDFNQFGPVFESWRGCPVAEDALQQSIFLHELSGRNRLALTTCRRSDTELFDCYSSLIAGGSRFSLPLPDVLAEARARFNFKGDARHNLVISHRKRIRINKEINERTRPEGAVYINSTPIKGQMCAAQPMYIWPGIELLGCSQASNRVRNNVLYTVRTICGEAVTVVRTGSDEVMTLNLIQVGALLRLSTARTYASVQGTEFESTLRLHDTTNKHFTMKHLFVAISRAKQAHHIDIAC